MEGVVVDIGIQTSGSHGPLARGVAPLAAAAVTGTSGFDIEALTVGWIAQSIIDEGLHTHSAHGVEEVASS